MQPYLNAGQGAACVFDVVIFSSPGVPPQTCSRNCGGKKLGNAAGKPLIVMLGKVVAMSAIAIANKRAIKGGFRGEVLRLETVTLTPSGTKGEDMGSHQYGSRSDSLCRVIAFVFAVQVHAHTGVVLALNS